MKLSLNLGLGFEMVQDSIKMILRWSKMAPRWSKRVPREPQDEASWAKMTKIAPNSLQQSPKIVQDGSKMSQDGPLAHEAAAIFAEITSRMAGSVTL